MAKFGTKTSASGFSVDLAAAEGVVLLELLSGALTESVGSFLASFSTFAGGSDFSALPPAVCGDAFVFSAAVPAAEVVDADAGLSGEPCGAVAPSAGDLPDSGSWKHKKITIRNILLRTDTCDFSHLDQ